MLVVETVAKIRRAFFVQQKPIKQICRELKVSRKVVRKVIRSQATAFRYTRTSQPAPKLGPWRNELDRILLANAAKVRRERLTLTRIFEALRGLGYEGGLRRRAPLRRQLDARARGGDDACLRAARLRAGRGLPVRLEP